MRLQKQYRNVPNTRSLLSVAMVKVAEWQLTLLLAHAGRGLLYDSIGFPSFAVVVHTIRTTDMPMAFSVFRGWLDTSSLAQ